MKEELCKEFCNQIVIREVPAGLAVGTDFAGLAGDPIGFYVVGPDASGAFRVEDSGSTVPILEACGADVGLESRATIFRELLDEYGVEYDEDRGELKSPALLKDQIPKAALRFVAFLLRLQDITFLTKERAENTFKQEVIRDVTREIGTRATIAVDEPLTQTLADFRADIIIRSVSRAPVAVFLVREAARMYEAMLVSVEAELKAKLECHIIALMETNHSVSQAVLAKAMHRVIPLQYRGEEKGSIARIAREAIGLQESVH